MNAIVTMRQVGQSKKMAEARVYFFWHPLYIFSNKIVLAVIGKFCNECRYNLSWGFLYFSTFLKSELIM